MDIFENTDDEDEGEDNAPILSARARVNVIIEAGEREANELIKVLLLEHKTPGTFDRTDWTAGMSTDKNLRGNAIPIAMQTRKYMCRINVECNRSLQLLRISRNVPKV